MANAYYAVALATFIADIKSALQTQYGSGNVTVHYETKNYLIFSCSVISNKVIRIYWSGSVLANVQYGDAWTSGSTITNGVQFAGYSSGTASAFHLVLGDSFFLLVWLAATQVSGVIIIGKMTNDKYICAGLMGQSTYAMYTTSRNTTDNVSIFPVTFSNGFTGSSSKLYKSQIIYVRSDGTVEEELGGNIAGITGLYNISYYTGGPSSLVKAANYLITPCNLYMSDAQTYLRTGLLAEW